LLAISGTIAAGRLLTVHGIIFGELKAFADTHLQGGWTRLAETAGLSDRSFEEIRAYPDADAVQLIDAASRLAGMDAQRLLGAFGEFIAPSLIATAAPLLDPAWKAIEVLEHTERAVHAIVRLDNPGADPPKLRVHRTADDEVTVLYDSPRRMCSLAIGICRGLGAHFGQQLRISETSCMLEGGPECRIVVSTR
jgi:hypothetical protein